MSYKTTKIVVTNKRMGSVNIVDMFCKIDDLEKENQQLKENIGKAINYIDQVIGYKPCAREIDKELNTLVGILREIK